MLKGFQEEKSMQEILQKALLQIKGEVSCSFIKKVDSLTGGCIHKTWRLELNDGRYLFAKTAKTEDFPKLKFEAEGLKSLNKFVDQALIIIPQPLILEKLDHSSVLLLPWLDLTNGDQTVLGKALALLHKSSTNQNPEKYGWEYPGYIGSSPQLEGSKNNWGECFVRLRLLPQLKIGKKWGLNLSYWENILTPLSVFLEDHKPKPSLVHGDLWSGNAAIQRNGKAVIFDPAVWWADREVDIAMTKLFGGFSQEFYKSYESVWPLPSSAYKRVEIYNLYHLLNHANIFGGSYKSQCLSTLENIKSTILS